MSAGVYIIHIPKGSLYLYGANLDICVPYIDDCINCVEDVCDYCHNHQLQVFYEPNHKIGSMIELFRVIRLTSKYHVYSSRNKINQFLNSR